MNIELSIRAAMLLKQRVVKDGGVGADLQPLIEVWRDDGLAGIVYLSGRDTPARLREIRAAILAHEATGIVFVMESYFEIGPDIVGEDLQRRFGAGDETVAEAVMVNVVDHEGRGGLAVLPYRYVGRKVRWLPPPEFETAAEVGEMPAVHSLAGEVPEGMMAAFAESALLTDRTAALQGFEDLGLVLEEVPVLVPRGVDTPGRNARCPCGSGLKFKQCCLNTN